MRSAVVFAGGPHGPPAVARAALDRALSQTLDGAPADLVVAVDSGLHLAVALGTPVHMVVGDMDSVDPGLLAQVESAGVEVRRHPVDKDATDLELALDVAAEAGIQSVLVLGSDAGRMDHLLGGVLTLASPRFSRMSIRAVLGAAALHVVHDTCALTGTPGATVSILAVNGPANGVRTDGLRWPLDGERLDPGTSRGLSNEFLGETARVSVDDGCVVVVVPEEEQS